MRSNPSDGCCDRLSCGQHSKRVAWRGAAEVHAQAQWRKMCMPTVSSHASGGTSLYVRRYKLPFALRRNALTYSQLSLPNPSEPSRHHAATGVSLPFIISTAALTNAECRLVRNAVASTARLKPLLAGEWRHADLQPILITMRLPRCGCSLPPLQLHSFRGLRIP